MNILRWNICLSLIVIFCKTSAGRPVGSEDNGDCSSISEDTAKLQLARYGYAGNPTSDEDKARAILQDGEIYREALRQYQRFFKLPQTGILDWFTRCQMSKPRCAVPDKFPSGRRQSNQSARYVTPYSQWNSVEVKNITWNVIDGYYDDLSKDVTDKILEEAFQKWSNVANICFFHNDGAEQYASLMDIHFVRRDHSSITGYEDASNAFDGPYGVLAHAFFPVSQINNYAFEGDTHFDADEVWSDGQGPGFKLDWVAAHEIGHAIGIGHSEFKDAIMWPYYSDTNADLSGDDIDGARSLYGARIEEFCPTPTTPEDNDCAVDAVVGTRSGNAITIKGDVVKSYGGDLRTDVYEQAYSLNTVMNEVDESVTAAMGDTNLIRNGKFVFVFSSSKIWLYEDLGDVNMTNTFNYKKTYDLSTLLKPGITIDAGFMDKCKVKKKQDAPLRKRNCAILITGTDFFQFMYTPNKWQKRRKLFRPIVNQVIVPDPQPMPLSYLSNSILRQVFPPSYVSTGVDAAARLNSVFVYIKDKEYIKMKKKKDNVVHSSGGLIDILDCSSADV